MRNVTLRGLASFASSLDGGGHADVADRVDVLIRTAQFSPDEMWESERMMGGFDPESDAWRAPLQTRLHWSQPSKWQRKRGERPQLLRPHQLRSDPDWVSPGVRPWHVGEGIEGGPGTSEFEITAPGWHHMDPDAPVHTYTIDEGQVWDRLVEDIGEELGVEADSIPELMSKLVHMQYVRLRHGGDEDQFDAWEAGRGEGGERYDPEVMERAVADVRDWIERKFGEIEERMQENFEEPEPDYDPYDDRM